MLISKRQYDRDDRTERIIDKQMQYIRAGKTFNLKFGCTVGTNGLIHMKCVRCRRSLPRDARHFSVRRGARNFWTCEPGHEWLNNSNSLPCLTCATLNRASIKRGVSRAKETCTVADMFDFRCSMAGFDFCVSEQVGAPIIAIITTSSSPILA